MLSFKKIPDKKQNSLSVKVISTLNVLNKKGDT